MHWPESLIRGRCHWVTTQLIVQAAKQNALNV